MSDIPCVICGKWQPFLRCDECEGKPLPPLEDAVDRVAARVSQERTAERATNEKLGRYDMRAIEASVGAWMRDQGEVGAQPQHLHAGWLLMALAEVRRLRAIVTCKSCGREASYARCPGHCDNDE